MVIIVVIGLALVALAVWGIMRWLYVRSLRQMGWEFDTSPDIGNVVGLNHSPFGMGFKRKVDDMITGTAEGGVPFRVLEYECDRWRSSKYIVLFPLGKSLPFLYASGSSAEQSIPNLPRGISKQHGPCQVLAPVGYERYADEVGGAIAQSMHGLEGHQVSIDHAFLVIFNAPKDAKSLKHVIDAGARVHGAVVAASGQYSAPPAPDYLSFSHRPNWRYIPQDDSYLSRVQHSTGGFDHEAKDIVIGEEDGIGFIRIEHHWKTQSRDSKGNTTTHHHREELAQFWTSFPFGALELGSNFLGIANERSGIQFESSDFNGAYKVTAHDAKFAHDVIHPRMMQWLLKHGAPKINFRSDGSIRIPGRTWGLAELENTNLLLREFFARVPDFVWQNLRVHPRPIPEKTGVDE